MYAVFSAHPRGRSTDRPDIRNADPITYGMAGSCAERPNPRVDEKVGVGGTDDVGVEGAAVDCDPVRSVDAAA
jgi:hypothetical protein